MSRIDRVLDAARRRYRRLSPAEVPDALRRGAVLVDIRPEAQRLREGGIPGALVIERNVLEWRLDPTSDARLPLSRAAAYSAFACSRSRICPSIVRSPTRMRSRSTAAFSGNGKT